MRVIHSLRVRLLLLVAVVAVPAIALTLLTGFERRADASARARDQGLLVAQAVARQDEQAVDRTHELLLPITALFASLPDFRTIGGTPCDQFFASLAGEESVYASVGVTNAAGDVVCSSVPLSGPVNLADRQYFTAAMASGGSTVGRLIVDRLSGRRTFNVASPILGAGGVARGVVFAAIDLARLQPTSEIASLPPGSFAAVTDRDGTILSRVPDPARYVGTSLRGSPLFATVLRNRQGTMDGPGPDGVASLVAYAPLQALGGDAFAIVGVPRAAAFAGADRALRRDLLLLGAVIAVAFAAGWYVSDRMMVRPIERIVDATERIAAGEFTAHAGPPYARGELGALARAFDAMGEALARDTRQLQELNATLERRVDERTAELSHANRELEAFTYSVSHDLRAPLRSVDGFSELLGEEFGDGLHPEARRYLGQIRGSARQMERLIDDLLQFSRVSRTGLSRVPTALDGVVEGALDEMRADLDGRDRLELSVGALGTAAVDGTLMRRVYVNLISNALKFTRTRDPARIEVGRTVRDGADVFYVRDNGVGFDMAHADRLFGVFQRLHVADEYEGTGVGLAIVERIVSRHGGRVWGESTPDEGATFYFTIGRGLTPTT